MCFDDDSAPEIDGIGGAESSSKHIAQSLEERRNSRRTLRT